MLHLRVERTIAAPPERVFDWLADPVNLTATPLIFRAGWSAPTVEPGVGAVREAVAVSMWLREEITAFDRPHGYSYRIIRSFPPMHHDGGSLTLTPTAAGTHVVWVSDLAYPLRAGGRLTEAIAAPLLRSGFSSILAGCAKALEG
ncbi:SRPBCC family protein [Mycobacterium sp. M26]|uniref:SRPBCC family protein n=1 Tax=Mycobacterium sp. M26 TaxID=1762962 RepID=UPI00073EA255|nr:SRPBCC family protein [Mycobacterium sp. M26]